ncbi:hypothetical protein QWT87_11335 [Chryseobacterium sp. APV1]|uniref:Uncharacterized protein n=1 Tax=Chryseobacterium urinae TaxID=3058400 RepID=A0ABT8U7S4_9FLAO|nr:hypothetical protein [Chryseobacterium sp. APV1]MDO3425484.1 hypothetical protein [Chryseobacterium sp. APV1]
MNINIETLVNAIYNYYNEYEYKKIIVEYQFTESGSYKFFVKYIMDSGDVVSTTKSPRPIDDEIEIISKYFENTINTVERFNKFLIEIDNNKNFSENHFWDKGKEKDDLLAGAEIFFQWANDRMMSMIFEFEQENNLLPTQYDGDGELEYLSSWDSGVFTFHINKNNELEYKIVLTKDGVERVLEMPLKDYFIEGILEHHKVTNTELSDEWKPWNTLIIKSPHTGIPYDKVDQFVNYTLE